MKVAREVIKNLNDKKIIAFDQYIEEVTVYANKQNIDILKNNTENYFKEQSEYQSTLEQYEHEINRLTEENDTLRIKLEEMQDYED